jgi:hypothetical protein
MVDHLSLLALDGADLGQGLPTFALSGPKGPGLPGNFGLTAALRQSVSCPTLTKGAKHGKHEDEDAKEAAANQEQTPSAHEAAQE